MIPWHSHHTGLRSLWEAFPAPPRRSSSLCLPQRLARCMASRCCGNPRTQSRTGGEPQLHEQICCSFRQHQPMQAILQLTGHFGLIYCMLHCTHSVVHMLVKLYSGESVVRLLPKNGVSAQVRLYKVQDTGSSQHSAGAAGRQADGRLPRPISESSSLHDTMSGALCCPGTVAAPVAHYMQCTNSAF